MSSFREHREQYVQTGVGNTILEVEQPYIDGTVVVTILDPDTNQNVRAVNISEIGSVYIQLNEDIVEGTKLQIFYKTRNTEADFDTNLVDRLNNLEEIVQKQQIVIETLLAAVDNRVNKHTFNVWIKAVEKSIGKPVLPDNLSGIQAVQIANP